MDFKKLQLNDNLQEQITYSNKFPALSICFDNFDDYFQREWSVHWHDEFEFNIVQKGSVQFTVHDGEKQILQTLRQGDGIFIGSGYLHSAKALEAHTTLLGSAVPINFFDVSIFKNTFKHNILPVIESGIAVIPLRADSPGDLPLLAAIGELCSITENEPAYEIHFIEAVCKIWRHLLTFTLNNFGTAPHSKNKLQEDRVKQMLSFIHTNFDGHIGIGDIAKAAAVSRTECFRCFQQILGKSPVQYITEYRLSMAIAMLSDNTKTMSEISCLCGFNSPSYFGKLFREKTGLSPKEYCKNIHDKFKE